MHYAVYWIAASPVICAWLFGNLWGAFLVFVAMPIILGFPPATNWPLTPAENTAVNIVLYAGIALLPFAVLWVRDWILRSAAERDARRALPPLGVALPGLRAIADQGSDRRAGRGSGARQHIADRGARPRIEPTLDKPGR